jgi:hypothetical protein
MDVVPFFLKVLMWGAVIGFALFVGSILAFALAVKLHRKRALKILAASICPSCGKAFGLAAAVAARQSYISKCEEIQRQHPGVRFRHIEVWPVVCPQCGATAEFMPKNLKLVSASS